MMQSKRTRFRFRPMRIWAVLAAAILLLSLSACGEGEALPSPADGTGVPSSPVQPDRPSAPQASQAATEGGEAAPGFPVSYTIEPPWHYLRSGKLLCTFRGVRLTDSTEGLEQDGFRGDASIFCGGESLENPAFLGEDGEHFVPGVYLLLVDMTVKSDGAESFTRRDRDELGNSLGEFDDPYLFRADDLVCLVDLDPKLASAGLSGAGGNDMDYFSGRNRRGEHPAVFRLTPGESYDLTVGFLISDAAQGGDSDLDWLYLAEGVVHDPKDALLHLELRGEEVLQG